MHPPVALALADWLTIEADDVEQAVAAWRKSAYVEETFGGADAHAENMFATSFALAREILREPS